MSNVAELRDILAVARRRPEAGTILFIDELHRFNKSQQDLLLPDVEEGSVRLIGATTHNPGFYVNPPLLSRSHLFRLDPLTPAHVVSVPQARAGGCGARPRRARLARRPTPVLLDLAKLCDGDLRRALNALEVLVLSLPERAAITARGAGDVCPRTAHPLRCRRGRALRHDLRLHQELPRVRSRCGDVLACQDAGGRRGPAVYCPPPGHPRVGGHRAGGSRRRCRWPWRRIRPWISSACPKPS
jgi:hypothetical protein